MSNPLVPFGMLNGRIVHVHEVKRGKACGCRCPACSAPLIARKGEVLGHHFAHESGSSCEHAVETTLHFLAKQIIQDAGYFCFPTLQSKIGDVSLLELGRVDFEEVFVECREGSIVPDVIGVSGDDRFLIEIKVTHGIDRQKLIAIDKLGLPAIELDLSNFPRTFDYAILKKTVLEELHKKRWVFHPEFHFLERAAIENDLLAELRRFFMDNGVRFPLPPKIRYNDIQFKADAYKFNVTAVDIDWPLDRKAPVFILAVEGTDIYSVFASKAPYDLPLDITPLLSLSGSLLQSQWLIEPNEDWPLIESLGKRLGWDKRPAGARMEGRTKSERAARLDEVAEQRWAQWVLENNWEGAIPDPAERERCAQELLVLAESLMWPHLGALYEGGEEAWRSFCEEASIFRLNEAKEKLLSLPPQQTLF